MCLTLGELRQAMSNYMSNFDAALVVPSELPAIIQAAGTIEKMAATLASLAAARLAGNGKTAGSLRLATEHLAKASGSSFERARKDIETAAVVGSQPSVAAAAMSGELSREQLALVSRAAQLNPDATNRLLGTAHTGSISELADEARRARAAVQDLEAARQRIHAGREVRVWTDQEGAWHLGARGLPEQGALITGWLRHHAEDVFDEARKQGRRERPEAYLFDALVRLAYQGGTAGTTARSCDSTLAGPARSAAVSAAPVSATATPPPSPAAGTLPPSSRATAIATAKAPGSVTAGTPPGTPASVKARGSTTAGARPGSARYEIMFRVDYTAMLRGYALDGETCEVAGFGTVTPKVISDIMDSGDPFLKMVITKGKDVVGVVHLGRRPNAFQKSALDWLFPTCAAEGCGIRADFLQSDHRLDWSKSHITLFDLLDRLCRFHHGLKTNQGWQLVHGRGKRPFVPPDDPRHPGQPSARRLPCPPP